MLPFPIMNTYGNAAPQRPQILKLDGNINSVLMLYSNGELYGWGRNLSSVLGTGNTTVQSSIILIDTGVSDFYCGSADFMYRKGNNFYLAGVGQAIGTSNVSRTTFQDVTSAFVNVNIANIKTLQIGLGTQVLTTDGILYASGFASQGEYGNGSTSRVANFTQVNTGVQDIINNQNSAVFMKKNDLMYSTGFNTSGQLGHSGTTSPVTTYTQVTKFTTNIDFSKLYLATGNSYYIDTSTNTMYGSGLNSQGNFGNGTTSASVTLFAATIGFSVANMTKVFRGRSSSTSPAFISKGNSGLTDGIYQAGYNVAGNIGNATVVNTGAQFTRATTADNFVSDYAGITHMLVQSYNTYFVYANQLYGCGATTTSTLTGSLPVAGTAVQSSYINIPTPY